VASGFSHRMARTPAEITVACAEAGVRAILCEKPLATRLSDADRAIRAEISDQNDLVH